MNSLSAQWSNWMTRLSYRFKHLIVGWLLKLLGKEEGINKLVTGRFRLFCTPIIADILMTEFDDIAPEPETIASNKMVALKWNFFRAAQSLIKCKPETIAAILNQWHQNPKFKNHAFKPQVILGLWFIVPLFAAEVDKAVDVIDLLSWSNKPLYNDLFTKMQFDAVVKYVEKAKTAGIVPALAGMPPEALIPVFYWLKNANPAQFNFRIGKLPPATCGLVRTKMREIDEHVVRIQEHGMKVKNFEKTDTLLERLIPPPDQLPSPEGSDKK